MPPDDCGDLVRLVFRPYRWESTASDPRQRRARQQADQSPAREQRSIERTGKLSVGPESPELARSALKQRATPALLRGRPSALLVD